MLNCIITYNYLFKYDKKLFVLILSLKFGWSLLSIDLKGNQFCANIWNELTKNSKPSKVKSLSFFNGLLLFDTFFIIYSIYFFNFRFFKNLTFGLIVQYKSIVSQFGTGFKINQVKKKCYYCRNGFSHKSIILAIQNLKFFLIKKITWKIKMRNLSVFKNLIFKIRLVSNKNIYKKKGIFFKNELCFLKTGKIVKN